MTSKYTHLHFRRITGLGSIVPQTRDGIGFKELENGMAEFQVSDGCGETKEKFADVLERMTRAGLCLQLGSTAPLFDEVHQVAAPVSLAIEALDTIQDEVPGQFSETMDSLRRTIQGQEAELSSLRKVAREVSSSLDVIRHCGVPEFENCVPAAGGLANVIWALLLQAKGNKAELDQTKAHVRNTSAVIDKLEAKVNTYNIHESAAVRQLKAIRDRISAASFLAMFEVKRGDNAAVDRMVDWCEEVETEINTFLTTLLAPDA